MFAARERNGDRLRVSFGKPPGYRNLLEVSARRKLEGAALQHESVGLKARGAEFLNGMAADGDEHGSRIECGLTADLGGIEPGGAAGLRPHFKRLQAVFDHEIDVFGHNARF